MEFLNEKNLDAEHFIFESVHVGQKRAALFNNRKSPNISLGVEHRETAVSVILSFPYNAGKTTPLFFFVSPICIKFFSVSGEIKAIRGHRHFHTTDISVSWPEVYRVCGIPNNRNE